jgi:hypothetical protein
MGREIFGSNTTEGEVDIKELRKYYGNWETNDLLKAVTIDKADYKYWAIEIINEELQRRGINDKAKEEFQKDWAGSLSTSMGSPCCPKCHSFNVTDRSLWAPFVGFIIFGLLIPRYRCHECGWTGRDTYIDKG